MYVIIKNTFTEFMNKKIRVLNDSQKFIWSYKNIFIEIQNKKSVC